MKRLLNYGRFALAALLAFQPVVQAAELSPVEHLLTRVVPQDEAALASQGPEKGERLAKLQSDLALVAEGLEGFASEEDAHSSLKRLKNSVEVSAQGQFKDRNSALDAVYRALAIVDYTWAKRLPDAPCSANDARARLLTSDALSSWIASLLGPNTATGSAASALDDASAKTASSVRDYALLRAKIHRMSETLAIDKASGAARASLYCKRAQAYEALSAGIRTAGPIMASRSSGRDDRDGVFVLARKTAAGIEVLGAATAVEGSVVTDSRLTVDEGLVILRRGQYGMIPARVERRDAGLALLSVDVPVKGYELADNAPAKDDLIHAIAHLERTGAWTETSGLVTSVDANFFQTDAVADVGMVGGAALMVDGRLAGVFVLRRGRVRGQVLEWPVAVSAPALRAWLKGGELTMSSVPAEIEEAGTTSILTASRSLAESLAPGGHTIEAGYAFSEGGINARCVANCDDAAPSSSYGSNGGAELGQALGKAMAPLVEALIFRGIPALFRGIGSLFKSKPRTQKFQPIVRQPEAVQSAPVAIRKEPEPKPLKIECHLTPVGVPASMTTETVEVKVRLSCDDRNSPQKVELGGRVISFSLAWKGKKAEYEAIESVTDANGFASFSFFIDNPAANAARSFNDLDRNDPDKLRPQNTAPDTPEDGPVLQTAARDNDLGSIAAPAPSMAEIGGKVKVYSLTGAGSSGIRSVARVSARRAAGVAAGRGASVMAGDVAAEALAGPVGLVLIGVTLVIGIDSELNAAVAEVDKKNDAIDTHKDSHIQDKFDALDKESSKDRERDSDDPECDDWREKVRRLRKGMRSLQRRLDEHLEKIRNNPGSRDQNHWAVETRAFSGGIAKNEAEARRLEALCGESNDIPR